MWYADRWGCLEAVEGAVRPHGSDCSKAAEEASEEEEVDRPIAGTAGIQIADFPTKRRRAVATAAVA